MLNLENDIVTPLKPKFNVRYGDDMFKTTKVNKRNIFFFEKLTNYYPKIMHTIVHLMKLKKFLDTKLTSVNGT